MRILIVEDEDLIAQRIERFTRIILGKQLRQLVIKYNFDSAFVHIREYPIDLLILDLNLNGKNGFQLLEEVIAGSFHTIILSAYIDKAIEAFDYGVLDFVPKPFNLERLKKAFDRYTNQSFRAESPTKFLAVRKRQKLALIDVEDIHYIKGSGNHSELILKDNQSHLHDKSLQHLLQLLPTHFDRIHKSYIVNLKMVSVITNQYQIHLKNGVQLPISRSRYKDLKARIS